MVSMTQKEIPTDAYSITFTKCLNDYGSGSFKVKRKSYEKGQCYNEDGTIIGETGKICFKCRDIHEAFVFEFIYENEDFVVEDGYYIITYKGAGVMSLLEHAKLWGNPDFSKLNTVSNNQYTFQYPQDSDNPTQNLYNIDMTKYNSELSVQGVYIKTYSKIVNGTYIQTDPRLIGTTIDDIVNNYNTETVNRNTNRINLTCSATGAIGEYKKECGTSYADILKNDLVNQLGLFIRDTYTTINGINTANLVMFASTDTSLKSVSLLNDDRIFNISGEYSSKENYQSFLTVSNDILVSCRDGSYDGKEGILPISDFIDPNNHLAYANQFIGKNQGSLAFNIIIDATGIEPFKDFDVGDLLSVSIPTNNTPLQIATENRVLSITYTFEDEKVIASIELNMNDKADELINLPKILQQEQRNRENTLKARMPLNTKLQKATQSTDGKTFTMNLTDGTTKTFAWNNDNTKITLDDGRVIDLEGFN